MWKSEILQSNFTFERERIKDNIEKLLDMVRKSEVFYFGDYSNFEQTRITWSGHRIEIPPAPFPVTLLEYARSEPLYNPKHTSNIMQCSKRANLFIDNYKDALHVISFYYIDDLESWHVCPLFLEIRPNDELKFYYFYKVDKELVHSFQADIREEFCMSTLLLSILQVPEIAIKTVVPPDRLNRARIRRKKEPLYEYHILEIDKTRPKKKYVGDVPWDYQSSNEVALHLCRGHFKTYTEEAPLFGKYTGTFWWNPSIRGSEENGIIDKDYTIKT